MQTAASRFAVRLLALAAVASLATVAAGCGGSTASSSPGVLDASAVQGGSTVAAAAAAGGTTAAAAAGTRQGFQESALAFAECLRGEGLDVPDPDFSNGGGGGAGGFLRGSGLDRQDPKVQAAMDKCRPLMEAARPQLTPEQQAQSRDSLLQMAKCLRGKGLDVPDPDFSSGGGAGRGGGFFGDSGLDQQDPKVRAALDTCRTELNLTGPGFGGQPGQGGPPPTGSTQS